MINLTWKSYDADTLKTLPFVRKSTKNDQIQTLQIVLHDRQNNFYAPVTPS